MADKYTSIENLKFLLQEVHHVEELFNYPRYQDYDIDAMDVLIDSVKDFSDKEMFPFLQEMDEKPVIYKEGKVIVHPQIDTVIKKSAENGWIGPYFDYEDGGSQMPGMLYGAGFHILEAANNNATGYVGLTTGAANLIVTFGNKQQKDTYVPKMLAGKWMGTMALTEPQAGSSLSDVKTSAKPREDGHYEIKGQKIFISGGDHQFGENFIHLTLARIEGAPMGTKGISLFIVPKKRLNESGALEDNDVFTAGDFQKVGQKGYATTHLVFGEKDNCIGYLVGEANRGLKYMFNMMNEARLSVGSSATSIATAAYLASLQYAKERPQGRRLKGTGKKDVSQEQTLIINHPDVRRMLLAQKAITEGALSLILQSYKYQDLSHVAEGADKEKYHLLLELLTPIAKTFPSEMGRYSINQGLQVLGGYGFCMDFPLQQYYRDIRIMPLYEGTTGIQSLDLLGRKIPFENGKSLQFLLAEVSDTMKEASTYEELKIYVGQLEKKIELVQEVLQHLMGFAMSGDFEKYLADATIFMEFFSTIVVSWQLMKQAVAAKRVLKEGTGQYGSDFYQAKIHVLRYYFKYELPKAQACAEVLKNRETITIPEEGQEIFG